MFCPSCNAEYRPGFVRCADCDVDLVNQSVEAEPYRKVRERETPDKWSAQLWRGTDPHFYLSLVASLGSKKVPCLGRPVNLPMYDSFGEQPAGSYLSVEFEVRVSEENLPFACWVLDSAEELNKKEEKATILPRDEAGEAEASSGVAGVCPLCSAEFVTASSPCPNCGVSLRPPQSGSLEENPAKVLCYLAHPQFLADLRNALHDVGIPFNNANFPEGPDARRSDVLVLDSDFDRATKVLAQVLQYWEFDRSISLGLSRDPREPYWQSRAKENGWYPEDLELLVWTGTNVVVLDSVGMALREHEIPYRVEAPELRTAKVFIHPGDEERARGIVRDAIEGPPPE
jgi:hypothetical protein